MNALKRVKQKTLLGLKRFFNSRIYLSVIEKAILSRKYQSAQPQLFVLGLPRSGTTLVYQYIVHRLKVAYLTNGVGNYPQSPCLVTFLQTRLHREYQSDFKSYYGKVTGPVAPREAGSFWGRFFSFERYVRHEDVNTKDMDTLKNTIACVQHIFHNKPFVNKNVKHMLRIDALSKIYPNSYFLVVERKLQDVALSVIRGRYASLNDPREWWSVKPPSHEELKHLPVTEQVARQLISLREKMERDFSNVPAEKILRVKYEQFCKNPESLIMELKKNILSVEFRNPEELFFEQSINQPQNPEEEQLVKLVEYYERSR